MAGSRGDHQNQYLIQGMEVPQSLSETLKGKGITGGRDALGMS